MTLAASVSVHARFRVSSSRRVSTRGRAVFFPARVAFTPRAAPGDDMQIPGDTLDNLARVLGASQDDEDEVGDEGPSTSAFKDPFADPTPDDVRRGSSAKTTSGGGNNTTNSFEAKRDGRNDVSDLWNLKLRLRGGVSLARAMTAGNVFSQRLADVTVGDLVVVGNDVPALSLWKNQHYTLRRIYFQRTDDDVGSRRVDANTFGDEFPDRDDAPNWTLYVELFSTEYHASPVRVEPATVGLHTVGSEIVDALYVAIPVSLFWAGLGYAFVTASR